MLARVSLGGGLLAVFAVFLALIFLVSYTSGAYFPNIKFQLPLTNETGRYLGLFVRNEPVNLDFNLTFDYPFPTGANETLVTAEIWGGGASPLQAKTIPLKAYLEKYGISKDGKYVFKPVYFNFSVEVRGTNVSYNPITFNYDVTQVRRKPYAGEDDKKWKIWGRIVQDQQQGAAIKDNYCSGPWDFEGDGAATGKKCQREAAPACQTGAYISVCTDDAQCCFKAFGVDACEMAGMALLCNPNHMYGFTGFNGDCACGGASISTNICVPTENDGKCSSNVYRCCTEIGRLGYRCDDATGTCVEEEADILIQRGAWDKEGSAWINAIQSGAILYFENGDSKVIPNEPAASPSISNINWVSAHAWKFEAYVYPTQARGGEENFKMYPDDGARFFVYRVTDSGGLEPLYNYACKSMVAEKGNWDSWGCPLSINLQQPNQWYKLEFYLYNDPGGRGEEGEEQNPLGLRVEDVQTKSNSLLNVLGTGSFISSRPPGADGIHISGSATVYANEGLKEVRDFTMFSTDHTSYSCDNANIQCSLRQACGNANYTGLPTNKYGWILSQRLDAASWATVGGNPVVREGYVRSGSANVDFDYSSVANDAGRSLYTDVWFGERKYIGGVYECKREWPSWEIDCAESKRYTYQKGSSDMKCCYANFEVPGYPFDYKIRLNDYKSGYDYIINFLPPYGNKGDKLCAISRASSYGGATPQTLYQSNYTNQFCDTAKGTNCCYCRSGWGCRLNCLNEMNMSAATKFTLPFPVIGPFWEVKNPQLVLRGSEQPCVVNLTSSGGAADGWDMRASLGDCANMILDKNYTIPLNLFSDFGLKAPEERGVYTLKLNASYNSTAGRIDVVPPPYTFHSVDCTKEGEKRAFYNESSYPGTKGRGACKAGLQVCKRARETDPAWQLYWQYETTKDMPVYPSAESCDGVDNDCNGIVDDAKSFDDIIDQIIASGGKKSPYEVAQCACFMGAPPGKETCDGVDDDCNGAIDDANAKIWENTCDASVQQCMKEGSPYEWCKKLYNSSLCTLTERTLSTSANVTLNRCTATVRECMNNVRLVYIIDSYINGGNFTYGECKYLYNNYSCFFEEKYFSVLSDTCGCTDPATKPRQMPEACNGIDDDCNGIVDDVGNAGTCGCAFLTNASLIHALKAGGDASCDGVDSDCNGAIDDQARDCACTARSAKEVIDIKAKVVEKCDGIDNNCDGLTDENFPQAGRPCGYGICAGGRYVCNVHGDEAVCNTTVNPDETFGGNAIKLKQPESCDLRDNDCDYSIDEDCSCTPEGAIKLCGYQNGVYYRSRQQLDQVCGVVVNELKKLITWAEAPENIKYRRTITVRNNDSAVLKGYPINVSLNSAFMTEQGKMRSDGGDLRIIPAGKDTHVPWSNSTPFLRSRTTVWFKTDLNPGEEKQYYMYYGNPTATYAPVSLSQAIGLDYGRGVFLLCHFDNTTTCEGNMIPQYAEGVTFAKDGMDIMGETIVAEGMYIDGIDRLSYPTSENFNKNRGTIMMWFKPTDLTEDHYLFYSKDLAGNRQFALHFSENGTVFEARDKSGKNYTVNAGAVNLQWHHIAATWDNLKGVEIYLDGTLRASKAAAWEANDIGLDVYIGGNGSGSTAWSLIEELAVYSQQLDQAAIREKMRYYRPGVRMSQQEETLNETVAKEDANIFEKCNEMLGNVSFTGDDRRATVLSLCDSARTCQKTDFPINSISECTFGTQACAGGQWINCTAVLPRTEVCDMRDDDCNGIIDDVAFPDTCACSNGGTPGIETCNGVDDDCNGVVDDVKGGASPEATHCGCFDQTVNITQRRSVPETACNGIDDNCNGVIDEALEKCACAGTLFGPYNNTWAAAIAAEKCDGVDNDCNGAVDDPWQQGGSSANKFEYLGAPCSPLNSRCVGGMFVCSKNATTIVCSTTSNEGMQGQDLRTEETCNAIDDDCNGKIDDVWGDISYKFCRCYNGIPRSDETCNGIDDDCDGLADNGLTNCGCSFGLQVGVSSINQLAVLINTKKTSGETCNNIDDDCNGAIDDGLEGKCFCSGGFSGNAAVKPEFCNGVDDDCDGAIDDVANPQACACYNGTHQPGGLQETCNGKDDDCNGLIDEDWPTLGSACGLGACSGGIYECSNVTGDVACSTGPGGSQDKSADEACGNGVDDNCDGVADESCTCDVVGEKRSCSVNQGECKEGIQTCTESGWSGCIGGVLPQPEACNGKDDDCNGIVDDIAGGRCGCYGGGEKTNEVCNGVDDDCNGIVDDVGSKTSVEATRCGCYDNSYAKGANIEVCDGIDDDCDGVIDNVKGGDSVPAARCACYNGALPGVESCNKIDDDCDGANDEDWPTLGQACGQGICTGTFVCSQDGKTVQCDGKLPEVESCDGKDNDCDGKVDEGCTGSELGSCENGIQDGDEEGMDCGGSCPTSCSPITPQGPLQTGTWMIVFAVLVAVIVVTGVILVLLKPKAL